MNMALMRSFTKEQLEMCDQEDLIRYILCLRSREEHYVKNVPLDQFIKDRCIVTDCIPQMNGNFMAPTSFDDIFFEFKQWCLELGHRCNDSHKKKTKGDLLKWQEETSFGLSVGQNRKEGKPNGTLCRPYFNLVVISED